MQRFVSSRRKLSDPGEQKEHSQSSLLPEKNNASKFPINWKSVSITLYVIFSIIMFINLSKSKYIYIKDEINTSNVHRANATRSLTYALYGRNVRLDAAGAMGVVDSGYLRHVIAVFERMGYARVDVTENWDVLWAHEYPFRNMYSTLRKLKPHQKVNHFPGSGYITNKLELSTSDLSHTPRAFRIPQDKDKLLKYAQSNANLTFVQKDNNHRGVTIKHLNDLDLTANGTFVQEFVSNPFLIDGHKFDIGVYTILTSINPLRVYIYYGDVLFRFCPVKYYPFDPQVLDKYVVGDDYLPIWKVPSLKELYAEKGFSMKDTFDAFIQKNGKHPSTVWNQINDAIHKIYEQKESKLQQSVSHYLSSTNFFEMVRIDFVVDEDLNVYLMEANMSPNLSSAHYPPNQLLYEQVLYNTLALVGVAQRIKPNPSSSSSTTSSTAEEDMVVALKNILVFPEKCTDAQCETCESTVCNLCKQCLTKKTINFLKSAYKEHVNRLDCRRVYPPAMVRSLPSASSVMEGRSFENQLMEKWFIGKCKVDQNWCT